jgi:hypothetical protein
VGGAIANPMIGDSTGHVFIYPEEKIVSLGDTFHLYIAIDTLSLVKSIFFDIEVDTTIAKVIGAMREPFYSGSNGVFFKCNDTVHTFPGVGVRHVYEIQGSLLGPEVHVNGPGRLVRLDLVARKAGMSGVIFRRVRLVDPSLQEIVRQDSLHGLIIVCPTSAMFGDADFNGFINITDAVYIVNYIFAGGPPPFPITLVGDADCNEMVNISDVVYLVSYIFSGGSPPCSPCAPRNVKGL